MSIPLCRFSLSSNYGSPHLLHLSVRACSIQFPGLRAGFPLCGDWAASRTSGLTGPSPTCSFGCRSSFSVPSGSLTHATVKGLLRSRLANTVALCRASGDSLRDQRIHCRVFRGATYIGVENRNRIRQVRLPATPSRGSSRSLYAIQLVPFAEYLINVASVEQRIQMPLTASALTSLWVPALLEPMPRIRSGT